MTAWVPRDLGGTCSTTGDWVRRPGIPLATQKVLKGHAWLGTSSPPARALTSRGPCPAGGCSFKRSSPERIVSSLEPAHLGLVSQETFDRVQSLIHSAAAAGGGKPRSVRATASPYQLRGLLHCGLCGRRMAGHRRGPTLYYRCQATDLIPAQQSEHPSVVYMREDTLIPLLEDWLLGLFEPDRLDATLAALADANEPSLGETTRRDAIMRRLKDAEKRLEQYKAALGQGADPALVSVWINEASADAAQARKGLLVLNNETPRQIAHEDLVKIVSDMSLVVAHLQAADPTTKAALYRELGLRLTYDHESREVEAEISTAEAWSKQSVRGGLELLGADTHPNVFHVAEPHVWPDWSAAFMPLDASYTRGNRAWYHAPLQHDCRREAVTASRTDCMYAACLFLSRGGRLTRRQRIRSGWLQLWLQLPAFRLVRQRCPLFKGAGQLAYGT